MKKSKSIELLMKSPDLMVPFDPNSNDFKSPIFTPEISRNRLFNSLHKKENPKEEEESNQNGLFGNNEICTSIYEDLEKKNDDNINNSIENEKEKEKESTTTQTKKYFSSADLIKKNKKNETNGTPKSGNIKISTPQLLPVFKEDEEEIKN